MDKVLVDILGLSTSPASGGAYALILREVNGVRRLPIIIGAAEAQSIALAVRYGAHIFVASAVMDEASFVPEEEDEDQQPEAPPGMAAKPKPEPRAKPSQLEQLHAQLKEAIEKENYEKAAALRDQIRKLEMRG